MPKSLHGPGTGREHSVKPGLTSWAMTAPGLPTSVTPSVCGATGSRPSNRTEPPKEQEACCWGAASRPRKGCDKGLEWLQDKGLLLINQLSSRPSEQNGGDRANTSGLATEHSGGQGPNQGPFSRELETKLPSLSLLLSLENAILCFSNKQTSKTFWLKRCFSTKTANGSSSFLGRPTHPELASAICQGDHLTDVWPQGKFQGERPMRHTPWPAKTELLCRPGWLS